MTCSELDQLGSVMPTEAGMYGAPPCGFAIVHVPLLLCPAMTLSSQLLRTLRTIDCRGVLYSSLNMQQNIGESATRSQQSLIITSQVSSAPHAGYEYGLID